MKKASRILYIIGNVFNIIEIVCSIIMTALGALMMAKPETFAEEFAKHNIAELTEVAQVQALGVAVIAIAIISVLFKLVIMFLANKAIKNLDENKTTKGIHIAMLVIGILDGDILYLIAGILALCVNQEQPAKAE